MRFIHTGDCHIGGWKIPELAELNLASFTYLVDTALREKIDFVVIAGDFFDSPYPSIESIKCAFEQLRRLKEAGIPSFIIAGSHDYSASGKSFLDVLEKAGFVINLYNPEERGGFIYLKPTLYHNVALYGYPGKRSALEVEDIGRIKLHEAPGLFTILALHTPLRDAVGNLPIPAVESESLPAADYTALAHLHVNYNKNGKVYCGPLFPNNALELEELRGGSFYVVDTKGKLERREVKLKEVELIPIEVRNAYTATDVIREQLQKRDLENKIVILRLTGTIETGGTADIQFNELEVFAKKKGAYAFLKNTTRLFANEVEVFIEQTTDEVEEDLIKKFTEENKSPYAPLIGSLITSLQIDKKEEERATTFEERLFSEFLRAATL